MPWAGRQEEHFAELIVFYEAGELWNPQANAAMGERDTNPFSMGSWDAARQEWGKCGIEHSKPLGLHFQWIWGF